MKLATWNVNSLRVRLEQVLAWSAEARPSVLALQETKMADDVFPVEALNEAGVNAVYYVSPDSAHDFTSWKRSLYYMSQLLFQQ